MERRQAFTVWVLGSAALMLVGAFGPWIKAPFGITVSGTDGTNDGWLVVGAAVIGGVVFMLRRESYKAGVSAAIAGLVGGGTALYDRQNVSGKIAEDESGLGSLVQIGWGLNLALAASVSLVVAGVVWFQREREPAQLASTGAVVDGAAD